MVNGGFANQRSGAVVVERDVRMPDVLGSIHEVQF